MWSLVIAILVSLAATACATNPVSGKRELAFISEADEIQLGRELDNEVRREMSVYQNAELGKYVEEIGMQLAKQSQRPRLDWHFTILDSPAVNAFALPGGYIYVTRGLLAFMDNEAQLAGVLGHEVGHVAARHAVQHHARSTGTSIGLTIASIFVPAMRPFTDLAAGGLGTLFLKFNRDDELQADALGTEYIAAGGWDPSQVPAVLTTLARIDELSDRNGTPNWLATHPQPESRVTRIAPAVQKVRTGDKGWTVEHDAYLSRIDGLIYGDNPEDGIVRGNLFLHPGLNFAIEFPVGWDITNSDEDVVAQEPGNKVFLVLRSVREPQAKSVEQVAERHMKGAGYRPTEGTVTTINGLEAFVGTYQGSASGIGKVMARGAHIEHGRTTYFVGGIASPEMYPKLADQFNNTIRSFRALSRDEADRVEPNLIALYTARQGDTWQSIAERAGKGLVKASTLAIMNSHAVDDQPKPGERLKIVATRD
jgi:predicted Zn-dependent protease